MPRNAPAKRKATRHKPLPYVSATLTVSHPDPDEITRFVAAFYAGRLCTEFKPCPHPEPKRTNKVSTALGVGKIAIWSIKHWGVPIDLGANLYNGVRRLGPTRLHMQIEGVGYDLNRFIAFLREFGFDAAVTDDAASTLEKAEVV